MLAFGCKESTTTTGTGNLTVAQVTGFPRISEVGFTHSNGRRFFYSIVDSNYAPIEHGIGYLTTDANTLVRAKILATYASATYDDTAPTAVSLASGTKYVLLTNGPSTIRANPRIWDDNSRIAVCSGLFTSGDTSVSCVGVNTLELFPYLLTHEIECTGLGAKLISTAASSNYEFGLFELAEDGRPGKLLMTTGSIDISTGANTFKSYSLGTNIRLYPGMYYIGWNRDNGAGSWHAGVQAAYGWHFLGYSSDFKPQTTCYMSSKTFGSSMVSDPSGTMTAYLSVNPTVPIVYLTCL